MINDKFECTNIKYNQAQLTIHKHAVVKMSKYQFRLVHHHTNRHQHGSVKNLIKI